MKKIIVLIISLCLLLSGCSRAGGPATELSPTKQYQATYLTLFDTVTTIMGLDVSKEAFEKKAKIIHDDLQVYHELFDIYNEYEGRANLKTINDRAGVEPVVVDPIIIEFLGDCRTYYESTDHAVNVAMGSMLRLWHETRTDGLRDPANSKLPDADKLKEAATHIAFDNIIIDEAASTVYISDPECSLDVGAIAKGWATQKVAEKAPEGILISVGGNVCATGPKDASGTPWVIGVQNPDDPANNLHTIYFTSGAVVTSGDYQRYYVVDGKKYHHIIDPDTGMPSDDWRAVTIVCEDSGAADALSTALFLLPLEEGKDLVEKFNAQAIWIDKEGREYMTSGFEELIRT